MNYFWKIWHIGGGVLLFTFWMLFLFNIIDIKVFTWSSIFSLCIGIGTASAIILGIEHNR